MIDHHTTTPAPAMPSTPPPAAATADRPTITLRIPKPNWQLTALLLVAVIAGFQTFQLVRLKGSVSAKTAAPAPTATASSVSATTPSGSGDLESQVGGC